MRSTGRAGAMTSTERRVARLYRTALALYPADLRARFADEQTELFLAVWQEECPRTWWRGTSWVVSVYWKAIAAALGARRDRRRAASARPPGNRRPFGEWSLTMSDLRQVVRSLMRAPGFTVAAILTLVLGLGVNLAVFTAVDRSLFRPLPFRDPDRLALVSYGRSFSFPRRLIVDARLGGAEVVDVAYAASTPGFRLDPDPESTATIRLTEVSFNVLDVLGAPPALGRGFSPEDVDAGNRLALVSYEAWRARLGSDAQVIGRQLWSRAGPVQIIGVLPPEFVPPTVNAAASSEGIVLLPVRLDAALPQDGASAAVARLNPDTTYDRVAEQFNALDARLEAELPEPTGRGARPGRVTVVPLQSGILWYNREYLWLAFMAASIVWLAACVNLSGLLLARGRSREEEVALRAALGASRARLLTAAMLESACLCVAAGALAALAVWSAGDLLGSLVPTWQRSLVASSIEPRVLGFLVLGMAIAVATGGALPAWRGSKVDLLSVIQRQAGGRTKAQRLRGGQAILVAQAAFGLLLVAGATFAVRNFISLALTDPGFDHLNLRSVMVTFGGSRQENAPRVRTSYPNALRIISQEPGVRSVGATDMPPAAGMLPMTVERLPAGSLGMWQAGEGLFTTLGIRLLAGRDVEAADANLARDVAWLSASAASMFWPDAAPESVVGRVVSIPEQPARQVVGIVSDFRDALDEPPRPRMFVRMGDPRFWSLAFAVRTTPEFNPESLEQALRAGLGDPTVYIGTIGGGIPASLTQPRVQAILFGLFAMVGVLIAVVGLYAAAAFDVARRRAELGVRLSLGATAGQIRRLVIGAVLRPVLVGIGLGLIATYWAGQFMESLLHQVDTRDPGTLALVALLLVATAVVAGWLPARRAARLDPVTVLRAP